MNDQKCKMLYIYWHISFQLLKPKNEKSITMKKKMIYKCKQNVCYVSIGTNSKSDRRLATLDCQGMDLFVTCSLHCSRDVLFLFRWWRRNWYKTRQSWRTILWLRLYSKILLIWNFSRFLEWILLYTHLILVKRSDSIAQ